MLTYLAVCCLRAFKNVSGLKSSDRSRLSLSRLLFCALSTQVCTATARETRPRRYWIVVSYLAVCCLRAFKNVSGLKSSDRSRLSLSRLLFCALSTQVCTATARETRPRRYWIVVTYLAVCCLRAFKKVSGLKSSDRSRLSLSRLLFCALSTQVCTATARETRPLRYWNGSSGPSHFSCQLRGVWKHNVT